MNGCTTTFAASVFCLAANNGTAHAATCQAQSGNPFHGPTCTAPPTPAQRCQQIYDDYKSAVNSQQWKNFATTASWAGGGCFGGIWGCIGGAGASDVTLWGTNWNLDTINLQYANKLKNAGCENVQW